MDLVRTQNRFGIDTVWISHRFRIDAGWTWHKFGPDSEWIWYGHRIDSESIWFGFRMYLKRIRNECGMDLGSTWSGSGRGLKWRLERADPRTADPKEGANDPDTPGTASIGWEG